MSLDRLGVEPARRRQIQALALPIFAGQLSQGLTSLVDTALVAGLDDPVALAGVAIGAYANFLACALVLGFGVGVQTLVARIHPAASDIRYAVLNTGLILSLLLGGLLGLGFYWLAPALMAQLSSDPAVASTAAAYFQYRCLAIAALGVSFCCRGFWNGSGNSARYLWIVLLVQASNLLLSYGLIYGIASLPRLGAAGSGLGSSLAILTGALCYLALTYRRAGSQAWARPQQRHLRQIIFLALPNSAQHFLVALAMSVFYALLGRIGVNELAIGHALINIALFIILPAQAFGLAATTLVSRALGQHKPDQAYRWGWDCLQSALPWIVLLSLPLWLLPELLLALFIPQSEQLVAQARLPLQLTAIYVLLQSAAIILSHALLGAADNRRVLQISTALQWLVLLPSVAIAAIATPAGIATVWTLQLLHWLLQCALLAKRWRSGAWQSQSHQVQAPPNAPQN